MLILQFVHQRKKVSVLSGTESFCVGTLGIIKQNWPRIKLLKSLDKRLEGIVQKLNHLFEEDLRTL